MTTRAALFGLAVATTAAAHPLGNFTTNRYAALAVEPGAVRIAYVVDMAELPAHREVRAADADGDGALAPAERDAWTSRRAAELARDLELTFDGSPLALEPLASALEVEPGADGLPTLRLDVTYRATLPGPAGELILRDRTFAGRPGWREVVATAAGGVDLIESTAPARDQSRMLRAYPDDLLQAPPRVSGARLRLAPAGAAAAP